MTFSGCHKEPKVETIYITKTCKTPNVICSFKGETTDDILGKYIECIVQLKRSNEVCK